MAILAPAELPLTEEDKAYNNKRAVDIRPKLDKKAPMLNSEWEAIQAANAAKLQADMEYAAQLKAQREAAETRGRSLRQVLTDFAKGIIGHRETPLETPSQKTEAASGDTKLPRLEEQSV